MLSSFLLASSLATCVVVVPTDRVPGNVSPKVAYEHELAHCNGWEHGSDARNLRNINPPRKFVHKPRGMKLEVVRVPTSTAEKLCRAVGGDSYACQWFE